MAQSPLSCKLCRTRKVKCSRTLPTCSLCDKFGRQCSYPTSAIKPGPKTGESRSRRKYYQKKNARNSSPTIGADARFTPSSTDRNDQVSTFADSSNVSPETASGINTGSSLNPAAVDEQASETTSPCDNRTLAWLLHPSHEPADSLLFQPKPSSITTGRDLVMNHEDVDALLSQVSEALETTLEDVKSLLDSYFKNMISYSLFDRPSFLTKLKCIQSPDELYALLAAMFTYSARFRSSAYGISNNVSEQGQTTVPDSEGFYERAKQFIAKVLQRRADSGATFVLLQAMILTTFHQLINGARSEAWQSVGVLVRTAYELQLHTIDLDASEEGELNNAQSAEDWAAKEELRRAWWAIWNFDEFMSTVRRLPTAIDWTRNETLLPSDDEYWFGRVPQRSCFLVTDPSERWQMLQSSGNQSAKAWHLVIHSYIRNALSLRDFKRSRQSFRRKEANEEASKEATVLENSIYCTVLALPSNLQYRGQSLFQNGDLSSKAIERDADIYNMHVLIQIAKLMLQQRKILLKESGLKENQQQLQSIRNSDITPENPWDLYLSVAGNIVSVVRSSSPFHFQQVNPLLSSAIWLAATIFLVYRYLGPGKTSHEQALAESNFALLHSVFSSFAGWWQTTPVLADKLKQLEAELVQLTNPQTSLTTKSNSASVIPPNIMNSLPAQRTSDPNMVIPNLNAEEAWTQMNGNPVLEPTADTSKNIDTDLLYTAEFQTFLDEMFVNQSWDFNNFPLSV